MKKNKKINIISIVIYTLMLLLTVFTIGIIVKLQILPNKYLISMLIIYIFLMVLIGFMLLNKKIKKGIKVFFNIISIIFIIIFGFGLYYLNTTLNFMDRIMSKDYQTEEYYVLVLKESNYNELSNLKDKKLGTYETDKEEYKSVLEDIKKKVELNTKEYEDYLKVGKALLAKDTDSILISATFKTILDDALDKFEESVKIIETIKIKVKNEVEVNDANVTNESFNIYISGIDIYGDISLVSRSDVNMIVTVNPKTNEVLLTSIPRDYYVQLHGTKGYKDKLTHAGIYGVNKSIETLEDLFDIDINYYVRVNFTTLVNLVDAIGGITVNSDLAFTSYTNSNCKFRLGNNNLDGKCALAFSRERYAYLSGDRHRVLNQQAVLTAILKKTLSSKTLITKYTAILKSLGYSFETNMPQEKIYDLINMQLDEMPSWNISNYSVDGTGSSEYTYSYGTQKLYVMIPDVNTVNKAKSLIEAVEKGL